MKDIYSERVEALLSSPRVASRRPPRDVAWPLAQREPPDLAVLYAACDGLTLDDGSTLFGKGEIADVTRWLVLEKSVGWAEDIAVIGERRDVVVAFDFDVAGTRAGGGVIEAASDDLEAFDRVATTVLGYLLVRVGAGSEDEPPPEIAARRAASRGDAALLERELARPMYPGSHRLFARLALDLGRLWAIAGDGARAMSAFERSVEAREKMVGAGGRAAERASGWRAAAHAARSGSAEAIAALCEERGGLRQKTPGGS
jgi:hypothetical protein